MTTVGAGSGQTASLKWIGITAAVLAIAPFIIVTEGATFRARLFLIILIFASFAYALDIVFGQTDQLFLFLGGLAGVGAYLMIGLTDFTGITPWAFVPLSALVAGVLGLIISYIAARRRMTIIVIAILTLSLQLASEEVFRTWTDLTGGTTGIIFNELEISTLVSLFETVFDSRTGDQMATYYTLLVVFIGIMFLYRYLMRSRYGLAFKAIRQDEIAAESIGINVIYYKMVAGFTAAFLIGLIGAFYAQTEAVVTPSMFTFERVDVLVLIMLVLGGMRTLVGPILGAIIVVYLNEQIRLFDEWTTAIFGLLIIVLFLYFREGIVPKTRELWYDRGARDVAAAAIGRLGIGRD